MSTILTNNGGNIDSDRYVDITSGVGGAAAFGVRQLTPRLFTTNELFPTEAVVKFSSAADLLNYMNQDSTSEEYKQGNFLFSYISKAIKKVNTIEIARWADTDTSAQVFGVDAASLSDLQAYTSASLDVILDGTTYSATGVDFSAATSYADVAGVLQTDIRALDASLVDTTVVFNSLSGGFDVDTNGTADGLMTFESATSGFLVDLGLDATAVFSAGILAQTLTSALTLSTNLSNNFGSIAFIDDLSIEQIEEVSAWVNAQNVFCMYYPKAQKSEASAFFDALGGYAGTGVTLYDPNSDEYPWLHPAAELGAIDPSRPAAFPNFMFGKNDLVSPIINSSSEADTYDAVRANYFGRTQEAGNTVVWYQRGYLMGGNTAPVDMSVFAAEMWLKSDLKSGFLNMFNALPGLTPGTQGRAIIKSYIQATVDRGLLNGAILTGKELTTTQKAYITQVTGDEDVYQQVQNDGYWYDIDFESNVTQAGVTEYQAVYTLIYSKADKVRKVVGTHTLI